MRQVLQSSEKLSVELFPGQIMITPWGFVRFEEFDSEGNARITISYNGKNIPGLIAYESEIDVYVDGGLLRVAHVDGIGTESVLLRAFAEPEFVAKAWGEPIDVSDILSADSEQLWRLADRYIEA